MTSKPLAVLFDAVHRGKLDFNEFLAVDPASLREGHDVRGRRVYAVRQPLRAYHAFLNSFLFEHLRINERVVYSYRRGATPLQAVEKHAHSRTFFQTDLSNFFTSLSRPLVSRTIANQTGTVPISDIEANFQRILDLVLVDDALAVGYATSPPLSNAVLTAFDDAMEAYCRGNDIVYTRYADDLIFSGVSTQAMKRMSSVVDGLLAEHFQGALAQNTSKQKWMQVGRRIALLGFVVLPNGHVTLDRAMRQKIEVWLHYFLRDRAALRDLAQADEEKAIEKLCGMVNYVNSVDQPYLDKLRHKYGATVVDSLLHRSATP